MYLKRALAAGSAMVALPLTVGQVPVRAGTPPPKGCFVTITPKSVVTCDGTIVWGAQHGVARVHSVVSVDAPRISQGMSVTFAWKVDATYSYAHHYYGVNWSCVGKSLGVKVLVRTRHGGFARYYTFGVVRRPA